MYLKIKQKLITVINPYVVYESAHMLTVLASASS